MLGFRPALIRKVHVGIVAQMEWLRGVTDSTDIFAPNLKQAETARVLQHPTLQEEPPTT